jgi:hypothetical protein
VAYISQDGQLLEILYEPEVPWFKIIGPKSHRLTVTDAVQTALEAIGKDDVSLLDTDAIAEHEFDERTDKEDVQIVRETQRMISWIAYEKRRPVPLYAFNEFRFPEGMSQAKHKQVWRAPEGIEKILKAAALSWVASEMPLSVVEMEQYFDGCQVSYSLRERVLYITSGEDTSDNVTRVINKLEAVVRVVVGLYPMCAQNSLKALIPM